MADQLSILTPAAGAMRLAVDEAEASKITTLSGKTLKRLSAGGANLGRFVVGRRVLYRLRDLEQFVADRATAGKAEPTPAK